MTNGTFRQTVHAILADDDHVVVLTDVVWDEPREFRGHGVCVWLVRDGTHLPWIPRVLRHGDLVTSTAEADSSRERF